MWLHSTLAVSAEGVPLGMLHQEFWCRDVTEHGKAASCKQRPIEDKESYKWINGILQARASMQRNLSLSQRPRLIHVMDREGDIYEVFECIDQSDDGAVIRCVQNRCVQEGDDLTHAHAAVRGAALLKSVRMEVPRKANQPARTAIVEMRSCGLQMKPSHRDRKRKLLPLTLVEVWEPHPPEGIAGLHWLLWTTQPVKNAAQAESVVEIYRLRWRIEEYHLVLKSGCKVEELQFDTAERTAKVIAMYAPIAVRILAMRTMVRIQPESPCTVNLSDREWRVLVTRIQGRPPNRRARPPSLRQAILWTGRLGGHLGRKSDGMPGVRTLWRGWRDLQLLVEFSQAIPGF